jgi:toluene monooxygenase system protein E
MATRKPQRLRTWSAFGDIRRRPTEYEIVTHGLTYHARKDKVAALESNPSTPMNMWYETYRDGSPLQVENWDGFRDPDEMTYRKYVTLQDDQETVVAGVLEEYSRTGHDAALPAPWIAFLASVFTPMRYPYHGLQMAASYLGEVAPSSYITNASAFAAGDHLRRVSLIAYRTRELQLAHPEAGFVTGERAAWELAPGWQGLREMVERALVTYDWGEHLVGINLVLRPTVDEILSHQLADLAAANGDELTWLLLGNLRQDSDRALRWASALVRFAVEQRAENSGVVRAWVNKWSARAELAAAGLVDLLADAPIPGDPATVMAASRAARDRAVESVGLLESV